MLEERELAGLKNQKKLNLCVWHIPEAAKISLAVLLFSYSYHATLFIKFGIKSQTFI